MRCQFSCDTVPLENTMAEEGEKSEENVVADEDLVVKKKSTSAIWNYFGFRRDDALQTQVLCKTCGTVVATSKGNNIISYSYNASFMCNLFNKSTSKMIYLISLFSGNRLFNV